MVIEIKKTMSKADMQRILAQIQAGKKLNARRFVGTVKWEQDPLAYQKQLRNEW